MNDSFVELGILPALLEGLSKSEIVSPTPIQVEVIPKALFGKDIIGQSATGTGKTLAYLLPLFQKIDVAKKEMQAIILAPTHELSMQIYHQIELLAKNSAVPVTAAPMIGKVNIDRQIDLLKSKPHIIVGSGGRILELIQKRKINSQTVRSIVIDEADRLLDDANWSCIKAIVKTTLRDRQLLLFSATITSVALDRAGEIMSDPEIIQIKGQTEVPPNISHVHFVAEQRDKLDLLRKLANHMNVTQGLVFINQGDAIETTVMKLNHHGVSAAGLFGDATKSERQKALADFRSGKTRLLVASDLAARGLDIPGVAFVFNLDMPEDPQIYLHRAGRTGRAGQSGTAVSIITKNEAIMISKIERVFKIKVPARQLLRGAIVE